MAETYYALTDIAKLIDKLISDMPTSFYSGIMAVRGSLVTAPVADVVARDCYDRLLAENDELRKERPVRHRWWKNGHCTSCGEDVASRLDIWTNIQRFSFCPFCGARMDGDEE